MRKIKVVQVGLGPIGAGAAAEMLRRERLEMVGGIDIDPAKEGKDVGVLAGAAPCGRIVRTDMEAALEEWGPEAAVLATVSQVERLAPALETLLRRGVNVVSSSEELLLAAHRAPELAARLDRVAKESGASAVAVGINPGFAMDLFPLFLTSMCRTVAQVRVRRCLDAGRRREPLQRKVGAGLTVEEFRAGERAGWIGHKGLQESIVLLCHGLGWKAGRVEETLEPVLAEEAMKTAFFEIPKGRVAGVHHRCRAWADDRLLADLDLKMYVGAPEAFDHVVIEGDPPLDVKAEGGIFGDTATVAALVNAIPLVVQAPPGLLSPLDLPMLRGVGE